MSGVLAKLAGQDSSRALAQWAKLRQQELSQVFQLQTMPHYSTWSRVLGHAVSPEELEQVVSQVFKAQKRRKGPRRGSIQVCLDGKTLQAQRKLSAQGDYVWTAKDNQPELREGIALLFAPQQSRPGWSAPPTDFQQATTCNKGHGRLESSPDLTRKPSCRKTQTGIR